MVEFIKNKYALFKSQRPEHTLNTGNKDLFQEKTLKLPINKKGSLYSCVEADIPYQSICKRSIPNISVIVLLIKGLLAAYSYKSI